MAHWYLELSSRNCLDPEFQHNATLLIDDRSQKCQQWDTRNKKFSSTEVLTILLFCIKTFKWIKNLLQTSRQAQTRIFPFYYILILLRKFLSIVVEVIVNRKRINTRFLWDLNSLLMFARAQKKSSLKFKFFKRRGGISSRFLFC